MSYVYEYAQVRNVAREASYPYTAVQRLCSRRASLAGPYRVKTYSISTYNSCDALFTRATSTAAVVAVAVGSSSGFMNYRSGVLSIAQCPANGVDHAVLLVGYDANKNWKIRNSWGTSWGILGDAFLAWGNTCNICRYGGYFSTIL